MGVNWACTLLGLVSLILCPIPFVFSKFGARIRRDSYFSPGFVSGLSCLRGLPGHNRSFQDLKLAARLKEKEAGVASDV